MNTSSLCSLRRTLLKLATWNLLWIAVRCMNNILQTFNTQIGAKWPRWNKDKRSRLYTSLFVPPLKSIYLQFFVPLKIIKCTGSFPSSWKVGAISPLLKSGSPTEASNYRPVAICIYIFLNIASKVLEQCIYDSIHSHCITKLSIHQQIYSLTWKLSTNVLTRSSKQYQRSTVILEKGSTRFRTSYSWLNCTLMVSEASFMESSKVIYQIVVSLFVLIDRSRIHGPPRVVYHKAPYYGQFFS